MKNSSEWKIKAIIVKNSHPLIYHACSSTIRNILPYNLKKFFNYNIIKAKSFQQKNKVRIIRVQSRFFLLKMRSRWFTFVIIRRSKIFLVLCNRAKDKFSKGLRKRNSQLEFWIVLISNLWDRRTAMRTDDRPSLDRVFRHNVAVSSSCRPHSRRAKILK